MNEKPHHPYLEFFSNGSNQASGIILACLVLGFSARVLFKELDYTQILLIPLTAAVSAWSSSHGASQQRKATEAATKATADTQAATVAATAATVEAAKSSPGPGAGTAK